MSGGHLKLLSFSVAGRKLRCSALSEGLYCQMVVLGVSASNSLMPLGPLGIFSLLVQLH